MVKLKSLVASLSIAMPMAVVLQAPAFADTPQSQWSGVYSQAQAKRGDAFYAQYCLMCHGSDLMGGEMAPALIGGEFQSKWNELTMSDLFERVKTSMPLNAPGSLSREEIADILAYVLSKDNFPAGKNELPTRADALSAIKYLASKP